MKLIQIGFSDHALAARTQQEDKEGKIVNYNIYDITVSSQINSFVVMTLPFRISRA